MKPRTSSLQSTRLLDRVRERTRYLHYSLSTEKAYLYWIRFFIRWHRLKHPRDMGAAEVEAFLSMLATQRHVSASTHNQALSTLLFLYREVLDIKLPWMEGIQRPGRTKRIPSMLTKDEVAGVLASLEGESALLARLLYGTGMRLMEALRLRVKDVDFDRHAIIVREAKGSKDRVVMLPRSLAAELRLQMLAARALWEADRGTQRGGVEVPHALEMKNPQVGRTWGWFWMFPAPACSVDPHSGVERRHHLHEGRLQRGLKRAAARAGRPARSTDCCRRPTRSVAGSRKCAMPEAAAAAHAACHASRMPPVPTRPSSSRSKTRRCRPGSCWTSPACHRRSTGSATASGCPALPPSLPTRPNRFVRCPP